MDFNTTQGHQASELDLLNMWDCCVSHRCYFLLSCIPKLALKSIADVIHPLGYMLYTNIDGKHWKALLMILSNYVIVMMGLTGGLWYSVLHYIPTTYQGLNMAQNGLKVEIPDTDLVLRTEYGMKIKVTVFTQSFVHCSF